MEITITALLLLLLPTFCCFGPISNSNAELTTHLAEKQSGLVEEARHE